MAERRLEEWQAFLVEFEAETGNAENELHWFNDAPRKLLIDYTSCIILMLKCLEMLWKDKGKLQAGL